jgi:AbrB family looped-hinge helix DNA binding protein
MPKKSKKTEEEDCCDPEGGTMACCKMVSMVSVDDRGQMVLPKELRDKAGIKAGDKLAVISMEQGGEVCCISLIKADEFMDTAKNLLAPMMKEMTKED